MSSYPLVNASYCSGTPPTGISNAVDPTSVNRTIDAINAFTCNVGYNCSSCSTSGQTAAYYKCLQDTQETGKWSPVLGGCDRMRSPLHTSFNADGSARTSQSHAYLLSDSTSCDVRAVCSNSALLFGVTCADPLERGHADRSSYHQRDHVLHVRRGLHFLKRRNQSILHVHGEWNPRARHDHNLRP